MLFEGFSTDDFLDLVGNNIRKFCSVCRYFDECERDYFETDENGNFITDEDGDRIERDCPASCEEILSKALNEEI